MIAHLRPVLCASLFSLGLAACGSWSKVLVQGSGAQAEELRSLARFDRVQVAGSFELQIRSGDAEHSEVLVESHDNLLEYIETDVTDSTLKVRIRDGYEIRPRAKVTVVTPGLHGLAIAGSADVSIVDLDEDRFDLSIAGSSEVRAAGAARDVEVNIAGSGEVTLAQLRAERAAVEIAGSGDVEVWAEESLNVRIAGSGDVRYLGDPEVDQRVAGSGSVRRATRADP